MRRKYRRNKTTEQRFDGPVWSLLDTIYAFVGKTILVPLSSSLYVPGKLSDPENVIVDIGTGYYVKKVRIRYCSCTRLWRDDINIFTEPNTSAEAL